MKIQAISSYNNYNLNHKACNRYAKYSIRCLIAGATLFLGGNAVNSLHPNALSGKKMDVLLMNSAASFFSVTGTALGLVALKKEDE